MPWTHDDTSVAEVHFIICEEAALIANLSVLYDENIPNKWKGPVLQNSSQFSGDNLSLQINPDYESAPDRILNKYINYAADAIAESITKNQNLWVGLIIGEAKADRNYFDRWTQAPTRLF